MMTAPGLCTDRIFVAQAQIVDDISFRMPLIKLYCRTNLKITYNLRLFAKGIRKAKEKRKVLFAVEKRHKFPFRKTLNALDEQKSMWPIRQAICLDHRPTE
ncbi:MAG: hypothetical protein ACPGYX_02755, partial [Oceanobacter sp.]